MGELDYQNVLFKKIFSAFKDKADVPEKTLHAKYLTVSRNYNKDSYYWFRRTALALNILEEGTVKKNFKFNEKALKKFLVGDSSD